MCTFTFLNDWELNLPLPNSEVQEFLDLARKQTDKDWQVVPVIFTARKWFKTSYTTLYSVYVNVGHGNWQQINFYRESNDSSIGFYVTLDVVAAFFMGIVTGSRKS